MDFQIISGLNALPMSVPGVFIPGPQPSSVRGGNNLPPSLSSDGRCVCNVEPLDQLAMQLHHCKREPFGA